MKLTKNDNPDKYGYSGNGFGLMQIHNFYCQMENRLKLLFWTL